MPIIVGDHEAGLAALIAIMTGQQKHEDADLPAIEALNDTLTPWQDPSELLEALNGRLNLHGLRAVHITDDGLIYSMRISPELLGYVICVRQDADAIGPDQVLGMMAASRFYVFGPRGYWGYEGKLDLSELMDDDEPGDGTAAQLEAALAIAADEVAATRVTLSKVCALLDEQVEEHEHRLLLAMASAQLEEDSSITDLLLGPDVTAEEEEDLDLGALGPLLVIGLAEQLLRAVAAAVGMDYAKLLDRARKMA